MMVTGKQLGTANIPPPREQAEPFLWVRGVNYHDHCFAAQSEIVYVSNDQVPRKV